MAIRLALATASDDPRNPRAWSGTPHAIFSALQTLDEVRTDLIGPLDPGPRLIEAARKIYWRLRAKRYLWEREPRILRLYEAQIAASLHTLRPAVVLCLGTVAAAAMPAPVPYVVYVDTTFKLNVDYYPTMTGICDRSLRLGEAVDRHAFGRAAHVVVTSDWAAASVINDYGIPASRVLVVPIGAQHVCQSNARRLDADAQSRQSDPLRLLWIGVEWQRKGGDLAVAIAAECHRRGIEVELHIAGLTPEQAVASLPFVKVHGFLDARTQNDRLVDLFRSSFALLLPSRAENTSVVIADAASFGLPTFAADTGGMRTMVHEGVNGAVLPLDATASDYADSVLRWWKAPACYIDLVQSTRGRFDNDLSWPVAIRRIAGVLASVADQTANHGAAA